MKKDKHQYENKFKQEFEKKLAKSLPEFKCTIAVCDGGVYEGSIMIASDVGPLGVRVVNSPLVQDGLEIFFFDNGKLEVGQHKERFVVTGLANPEYSETHMQLAVTVALNYLITGICINRVKLYANMPTLAVALESYHTGEVKKS